MRAAGIILYRRAADRAPEFLLLETRKGGHYSPPKGHCEPGETDEEAARREAIEECGLEPRSLDPSFREEIEYGVLKKGRPRLKSVIYLLGEAPPGPVLLSDEHLSARWARIEEVERLVAFENLRAVFRLAAKRIAKGGG